VAEARLLREPIDPQAVARGLAGAHDGAVASFTGVVRNHQDGREVLWLEYQAYEEMAEKQMGALIAEALRRWPISDAAIAHRLGRLEIGHVSVVVVVAAPHRAEAFAACQWLIDTLKAEVPIFKKEKYADGEAWVGEPAGDLVADR
jgi:molybdopterin synthase catalytic subunit